MFLWWFLAIFNAQIQSENVWIHMNGTVDKRWRLTCELHVNLSCNLCAMTVWEMHNTSQYQHSQWANLINVQIVLVSALGFCMACRIERFIGLCVIILLIEAEYLSRSYEVLGHYVAYNVTKFQSCRNDNKLFIGEKPSEKHFDENNIDLTTYYRPVMFFFQSLFVCLS